MKSIVDSIKQFIHQWKPGKCDVKIRKISIAEAHKIIKEYEDEINRRFN